VSDPSGAATEVGVRPRVLSARSAKLVVRGMRPSQWIKNTFVLAGLIFSGEVLDPERATTAAVVFVGFCLASGAAYLLNDVVDAEFDRHNPRTAGRPIASGELSPAIAIGAALLCLALAFGCAATANWQTVVTLAGFVGLQAAYSGGLKHVLFVDVIAIAAGFVLRAYAGLIAIDVPFSVWLLLCTGLVSLLLGLGKRRAELVALGAGAQPRRPVLDGYSVELVDELTRVVTPAVLVAYCLYAVLGAETQLMLLTAPFVLYGIFRVLYLMGQRQVDSEDPALMVWQDRPLLVCILLWGASAGAITLAAT
jgi:4-hydroxybenzoate polyprenyltransferase